MLDNSNDLVLSSQALAFLEELASTYSGKDTSGDKKKVLPVKEWLDTPYYTGELGRSLYPFWRDKLEEIFDGYTITYDELIVTGGIRTGKTWLCIGVWMRMLYLLSLIDFPQDYLGLARTTEIVFAYLSITIQSSLDYGFGELTRIIDSAPYFIEEFPRDPNNSKTLHFPKNIMIVCGSDYSRFTSSAMLSLFYDEGNFAKSGGGKMGDLQKAMSIYSNARTRTTNQFSTEKNTRFAINMLVSSTTHKGSFTEVLIHSSKNTASTKVIQATSWITKPKGTYSDTKFLFFSGTELHDPKCINKKEDLKGLISPEHLVLVIDGLADEMYNSLPSEYVLTFFLVPINFKKDAELIPQQFVKDTLGISLAATGKFFTNKPKWESACLRGSSIPIEHPFTKSEITLSRQDSVEIRDYFKADYLKAIVGSNPIYIHIDQSESGCSTGIVISFPLRFEGEELSRIFVPGILRINPPGDDDKISLVKIRTFIEDLRDRFGFNIGKVTFDQYQSSQSIEILAGKKFPVGRLSVDESDGCWFEVADAILRDRVIMYSYPQLEKEWFDLVHDRASRKVRKPENGTKDVADAYCGSVYNCLMAVDPKLDAKKQSQIMSEIFKKTRANGEPDYQSILLGGIQVHELGKPMANNPFGARYGSGPGDKWRNTR